MKRPNHYSFRNRPCDDIHDCMKTTQVDTLMGYYENNVIKYLYRYPEKNGVEDLQKAISYIEKMIDRLEDEIEGRQVHFDDND